MNLSGQSANLQGSFPFTHFLQTGHAPKEEEASAIRHFIQTNKALLDEFQQKIDSLYDEAAVAHKAHYRLRSDIEACSSILSLVRHFPDDVLGEIFCHCLPTDGNAILKADTAPMVLTQICSHWRRIALTIPALWTSVHVPMVLEEIDGRLFRLNSLMTREQSFQRAIGRANFVSQWLQLSGVLPLNISLFVSTEFGYARERVPPQHFVDEYIKAVKPFSKRWRSIRLSGGYSAYREFASLSTADVPCLESLSLALVPVYEDPDGAKAAWIKSGLLRTASLRRLRIKHYEFELDQLGIPWSGLTHLTLGSRSGGETSSSVSKLTEISRVLKECAALISFHLYLRSVIWSNDAADVAPTYLPSLRCLILEEEDRSTMALAEKLEAPGLEEITFSSHRADAESVIATLVAQTSGDIRGLSIEVPALPEHVFQEILRQTPKLRSLILKQIDNQSSPSLLLGDDFLNALTFPAVDGSCLCPSLEEFECEYRTAFTHAGVLNFVNRKGINSGGKSVKLKKFHIRSISSYQSDSGETGQIETKDLYDELKRFIDAGLDFSQGAFSNVYNASEPHVAFSANEGWLSDDDHFMGIQ